MDFELLEMEAKCSFSKAGHHLPDNKALNIPEVQKPWLQNCEHLKTANLKKTPKVKR